jgi:hypothetical protein
MRTIQHGIARPRDELFWFRVARRDLGRANGPVPAWLGLWFDHPEVAVSQAIRGRAHSKRRFQACVADAATSHPARMPCPASRADPSGGTRCHSHDPCVPDAVV